MGADDPQQRVLADRNPKPPRESLSRTPAQRQTEMVGSTKIRGVQLSGRRRDRGRLTSAAPTPRGAHAAQAESSDILARRGNPAAEDPAPRHQPDDLAPGAGSG